MESNTVVTSRGKELTVPKNAFLRVDWQDYPENRTVESMNRVKSYFSDKYSIPKASIKVNFMPIIKNNAGEVIDITDGLIDNIMDSAYQRQLFSKWVKMNDVTVDFDRLCRLDDRVNDILNSEETEDIRHRRWTIKNLWLDNFLSYGDGNEVDYSTLYGFNVVTSIPENQGGKTIFSIDALMFLFFGKTTKTDTAAEIFNTYRDKNEVVVGGLIDIDGDEYIIERKVKRKEKKAGGYTVSTSLDFYRILADGSKENLEGEQRRETDKLITDTIGSYDDFMTVIVATSDNLSDLIVTKPTQRGRLLTKFIGLEVIEKKEDINKQMMNDFKSKMKSNVYDTKQLDIDNDEHRKTIKENKKSITESKGKLETIDADIETNRSKREDHLAKRYSISDEIKNVNPKTLKDDIEGKNKKGIKLKSDHDSIIEQIKNLPKVEYNEDKHDDLREDEKTLILEKQKVESANTSLGKEIKVLTEGEICPTCKRSLEEVDHSKEIADKEKEFKENEKLISEFNKKIIDITKALEKQTQLKEKSEGKDRLILSRDRVEVELEELRVDTKSKMNLLKEYERNSNMIEENRKLESKILGYKQVIENLTTERDKIKGTIQTLETDSKSRKESIKSNDEIILQIKKEEEVLKIFEVYNRMVGKNGISKLVLSSVIPVINYEVSRLLDEVTDFEVELEMNSKNEVEFNIIKSNKVKKLKSGSGFETTLASLALRCVLGRVSTLPKPNIIVFDEVLGKVANVNLDQVKLFFDKIKDMYEIILWITHNPITQDWADKIITVEKNNDISSLKLT